MSQSSTALNFKGVPSAAEIKEQAKPAWQEKTANAWKRVLKKELGIGSFVMSRTKRIAKKIDPRTTCETDEECRAVIEASGDFFKEEPDSGDGRWPRAAWSGSPYVKK